MGGIENRGRGCRGREERRVDWRRRSRKGRVAEEGKWEKELKNMQDRGRVNEVIRVGVGIGGRGGRVRVGEG